jgi:hypothetical protein
MEFHVSWHRVPASAAPHHALSGEELATPWELSFEEALAALERLDRLFAEPDGSFVWRPGAGRQVDGQLFDRQERLAYVELHGLCHGADVDRLHAALNPSKMPLAVQVIREGVIRTWDEWREGFQD